MRPVELALALKQVVEPLGSRAEASAYVTGGTGVWIGIRPMPYPSETFFSTSTFADWEPALEAAREKVIKHLEVHSANTIRDVALAIVRITYDQGQCTDAALRVEFDADTVERFGAAAVERANAMAEGAPFSIVDTGAGNGAPDDDMAEAA